VAGGDVGESAAGNATDRNRLFVIDFVFPVGMAWLSFARLVWMGRSFDLAGGGVGLAGGQFSPRRTSDSNPIAVHRS